MYVCVLISPQGLFIALVWRFTCTALILTLTWLLMGDSFSTFLCQSIKSRYSHLLSEWSPVLLVHPELLSICFIITKIDKKKRKVESESPCMWSLMSHVWHIPRSLDSDILIQAYSLSLSIRGRLAKLSSCIYNV